MLAGAVAPGIETYGLLFGADFVLDFSESQRIDVEFRIDAAFWISPLPGNLMASMTGCFWPEDGFDDRFRPTAVLHETRKRTFDLALALSFIG